MNVCLKVDGDLGRSLKSNLQLKAGAPWPPPGPSGLWPVRSLKTSKDGGGTTPPGPCSTADCPHGDKTFPYILADSCLFFLVLLPCTTVTSLAPSSCWPPGRNRVVTTRSSSAFFVLQPDQAPVPQPLLTGQALQSPEHPGGPQLSSLLVFMSVLY